MLVGGADADVGVGADDDVDVDEDEDQPVGWDWLRFRVPVAQVASVGRWIVTAADRPALRILWSGRRIGLD